MEVDREDKDMLSIEKFQNNFKVTIQGGLKSVHEWTEDGEGEYCFTSGMEYYNGNFDVDICNIDKIGQKILEHINNSNYSNFKETDLVIIDNRITWNQIEDVDCNILQTVEDQDSEDKTYICVYDLFISINGVELSEDDLREILPKAD